MACVLGAVMTFGSFSCAVVQAESVEGLVGLEEKSLAEYETENTETDMAEKETEEEKDSIYHVMLIGVDRRDDSWEGNSDTMMLVTINDEKKQVSMISMMRDMGVNIPGIGLQKMNAATANGGAKLLLETVQQNFGVDVQRYVKVDFENVIDIVDAVGGVELTLSDAEAGNANIGISEVCYIQGISPDSYLFPCGGTYLCNGMQAVNYARIRYIGNADYERTERQRTVMTRIIEKLKEMDAAELMKFAKEILPLVEYNIPMDELLSLVMKAPQLAEYDLVKDRIPYDGLFYSQNELLMPDWPATLERLNETIY